MAALESFVASGTTLTRDAGLRKIIITGGVLVISGTLDNPAQLGPMIPSLVSSATDQMYLAQGDYPLVTTGDSIIVGATGGYSGLTTGTTYYLAKTSASNYSIKFCATYADAVAATPVGIDISGTGTTPNVRLLPQSGGIPGGYTITCSSSGGLRFGAAAVATVGDDTGMPVIIDESPTAHRFGGDNYTGTASRFVAGAEVVLKRVLWTVFTGQSGTRSDFDTSRGSGVGADVTFKNCQIETDSRFNHLAGSALKIENLRFRNNTQQGSQVEFSDALTVTPTGFVIDAASDDGAYLRFLTDNFTADVAVQFADYSGVPVDLYAGNATKILQLNNPDGDIAKNSNDGVLRIHRSQPIDLPGGGGAGTLYMDSQDSGGADASVLFTDGQASVSPLVRTKYNSHDSNSLIDVSSYIPNVVGYGFRKAALSAFDVATAPVTKSLSLVADRFPNGDVPAASSLTAAATLDDVYLIIKTYEVANRSVFGKSNPVAVISADRSLTVNLNAHLTLSSTQAGVVTGGTKNYGSDAALPWISIKCAATLGASLKGLVGINLEGVNGQIDSETVNTEAFLTRDSVGASTSITVTVTDADVHVKLFSAAGVALGTDFVSTATSKTKNIKLTQLESAAGQRLVAYKIGYEAQIQRLNTSAGGGVSFNFGALRQIINADSTASYSASSLSASATVTFVTTNLAAVDSRLEIGNVGLSAVSVFSEMAVACATPAGLKYLAFDGGLINSIPLFSGDIVVLPPTCKLKRATVGDASASVLATVLRGDGEIIDSTNGDVTVIGGLQISDFQYALLADFDIDPDTIGIQTVAGILTDAHKRLVSAATDIPATLLATVVEEDGDTVKQALARIDDVPIVIVPTAAQIVAAIKAAAFPADAAGANRIGSLLASLVTKISAANSAIGTLDDAVVATALILNTVSSNTVLARDHARAANTQTQADED